MTNVKPAHSEEYIGDHRYAWWNKDYISLLLRRIKAENIRSIADFGVGAGHWSAALISEINAPCHVTAVDFEQKWLDAARKTLESVRGSHVVETVLSDVHQVPLSDNKFDLVTCQTVLMHCKNPEKVLKEMTRCVKPGGCVMVIEPTNILNRMQFFDALNFLSPEDQSALFHAWACYHAGQKKMTGANHDIAPQIPDMMARAGLTNIVSFQNDRVFIEPHTQDAHQQMQAEYKKEDFAKFVLAGGGTAETIEATHSAFEKMGKAAEGFSGLVATPVGSYLFIGIKPR